MYVLLHVTWNITFFPLKWYQSVIPKATPCMRFAIMRFTPYSMLCTIHWLTLLSLTSRPSIGNMSNESRYSAFIHNILASLPKKVI